MSHAHLSGNSIFDLGGIYLKEITIYYDDTKQSCQTVAREFSKYDNVQCKKASDYEDQKIIFTNREKVGFVFESQKGNVPYGVSHVMWKMVGDKTKDHMLCVTGGSREFNAVKTACSDLKQRGYHISHIYTKYILTEKYKLSIEDSVKKILSDMMADQADGPDKEEYKAHSGKELRRFLYGELKNYRTYRKQERKSERKTTSVL